MLIKIHKSYRDIVAICDSDLIGKKFEEDKFQLQISESFFGGDKKTQEEVENIINDFNKEDAIFNIIGEKSVAVALKSGIITDESIKKIQNIPFSMVLM